MQKWLTVTQFIFWCAVKDGQEETKIEGEVSVKDGREITKYDGERKRAEGRYSKTNLGEEGMRKWS